jgi:hypothetical protein
LPYNFARNDAQCRVRCPQRTIRCVARAHFTSAAGRCGVNRRGQS